MFDTLVKSLVATACVVYLGDKAWDAYVSYKVREELKKKAQEELHAANAEALRAQVAELKKQLAESADAKATATSKK